MHHQNFNNHDKRVLGTLHLASLLHNPRMRVPTRLDYTKVPRFLKGEWPQPWPDIVMWEDADEVLAELAKQAWVVIDTEYEPDNSNRVYQIGLYAPGLPVVIWDRHRAGSELDQSVLWRVQDLAAQTVPVFQHGPADIPVLELPNDIHHEDTVLAHAALYAEWRHGLEFLESLHGRHERVKHLGPGPYDYLRGDVVTTACVWEDLSEEFRSDQKSYKIYTEYLKPLTPVLLDFTKRGLRVDTELATKKWAEYTRKVDTAQRIAEAYCGYPINLDSSPQVGTQLAADGVFKRKPRRTKTGRISIKEDVIAELRDQFLVRDADEPFTKEYMLDRIERGAHPLLEARAGFIESRQLCSTFIEPLRGRSRIYPSYLPFAQANGRWSSHSPNIAQFPNDLLKLIVPDPGEAWVKFDWNAIEGRIEALMAGDQEMLETFRNEYDFHTINLCAAFDYPMPVDLRDPHTSREDQGWRDQLQWDGKEDPRRTFIKALIFRLFYGGKPETAVTIPGVDSLRAKIEAVTGRPFDKRSLVKVSRNWIKAHPAISKLWKNLERQALVDGQVESFLGRKRILFERAHHKRVRQGYDQPMQAAVSDIMNKAVIDLWALTGREGGHLVYTRHDCVCWALPTGKVEQYLPAIKEVVQPTFEVNNESLKFTATFEVLGM